MTDTPANATPTPDERFAALERKIDAVYVSVEKMRSYFFWTLVITVAMIVLPLVGMVFAIPKLIGTYTSLLNGM